VLKKRIYTLLQRGEVQAAQENKEKLFIEIDGLSVDAEAHQVRLNGESLDFTLKEFNILYLLIKKPGRVYSRDALIERVWSEEYIGSTRTIDSHVARIRIKLGEWGEKHLQTIYGTGYKIVK
jgi:DNA-binding response OmpR family regulator